MNTIASSDSYAQFMQLVATARQRSGITAAKPAAALRSTPVAAQAAPQARAMAPVSHNTETQVKGRILGNHFDAYA
jgi:hypothetical protein